MSHCIVKGYMLLNIEVKSIQLIRERFSSIYKFIKVRDLLRFLSNRKDCCDTGTQFSFMKEVSSLQLCIYSGVNLSGARSSSNSAPLSLKWSALSHIFPTL